MNIFFFFRLLVVAVNTNPLVDERILRSPEILCDIFIKLYLYNLIKNSILSTYNKVLIFYSLYICFIFAVLDIVTDAVKLCVR